MTFSFGAEGRRREMVEAILNELTAWNPRERMGMFRKWLQGSLSIIHLHVLTILEAAGSMPMGKLAEALDVSVASATGIIDRMEQRGLVERRHTPDDRRVVLVHPTVAGLRVFSDMDELRRQNLGAILVRLTEEELQSTLIGLRAMSAARVTILNEYGKPLTERPANAEEPAR